MAAIWATVARSVAAALREGLDRFADLDQPYPHGVEDQTVVKLTRPCDCGWRRSQRKCRRDAVGRGGSKRHRSASTSQPPVLEIPAGPGQPWRRGALRARPGRTEFHQPDIRRDIDEESTSLSSLSSPRATLPNSLG